MMQHQPREKLSPNLRIMDDGCDHSANSLDASCSHLKLFISYQCNLRCSHCVQSRVASQFGLTTDSTFLEQLDVFVGTVQRLNPNIKIYLSGGEPLLSPEFFRVARILNQRELTYKTITNGLLLKAQYNKLLEAPPQGIWVTFNGTAQRHDKIVGLNCGYDRLCESVKKSLPHLQRAGIMVGAVLMINELTYDRLSQDIEEIGSLGFNEVVVQHLSFLPDSVIKEHNRVYREIFEDESSFCFGEGANGTGIKPVALFNELLKIRQKEFPFHVAIFPPLFELDELIDYYSEAPQYWRQRRCSRALHEIWVHPDSTVTVCFYHKVGHIGQSFEQILASPKLIRWQQHFKELSSPLPGCMRCHRLYMTKMENHAAQ